MPLKLLGTTASSVQKASTAFESIASTTLSGVSTYTFSAIPSTYQHLQFRCIALGTDTTVYIRINGTSSASYTQHRLLGNGSSASAGGFSGETEIQNALRAQSTNPGVSIIDILDYAVTTKKPVVRIFRGEDANGSGNVYLVSGMLDVAGAVSSVTFTTSSNFSTGTRLSLYGIKGA
jgi:hypothetical protein